MNKPTSKKIDTRLMTDEQFASHMRLPLEKAKEFRAKLNRLQSEGRVHQKDDGAWYPGPEPKVIIH